jgi:hypothetical protein
MTIPYAFSQITYPYMYSAYTHTYFTATGTDTSTLSPAGLKNSRPATLTYAHTDTTHTTRFLPALYLFTVMIPGMLNTGLPELTHCH